MRDHSVRKPVQPPSPDAAFAGVLPVELIDNMRRGIPSGIIPALATRFGMSQGQLFDTLRLPRRSLKARISRNEKLSPLEQDRLYRADRIGPARSTCSVTARPRKSGSSRAIDRLVAKRLLPCWTRKSATNSYSTRSDKLNLASSRNERTRTVCACNPQCSDSLSTIHACRE